MSNTPEKRKNKPNDWIETFREELAKLGFEVEMDYSKAGQVVVETVRKPENVTPTEDNDDDEEE